MEGFVERHARNKMEASSAFRHTFNVELFYESLQLRLSIILSLLPRLPPHRHVLNSERPLARRVRLNDASLRTKLAKANSPPAAARV
eukprot:768042-Hanusia_phi.AAC.9